MKFHNRWQLFTFCMSLLLVCFCSVDLVEAKEKQGEKVVKEVSGDKCATKGKNMDKCVTQHDVSKDATPVFNALDIMKSRCSAASKKGGHVSEETESANANLNALGEAWLDEKGTIVLRMRRDADGRPTDGTLHYPVGDKNYDEVMKHLGGLKPGEKKLVLPWPD